MKTKIAILAALAVAALIIGCSTTGSPPTALEQKFFNVQTNIIPVTVIKTNVVTVTEYQGGVPITSYQTNVAVETNLVAHYEYRPGPGAAEVQAAGGALGNILGLGGLIGTGLGLVFSVWGKLRSSRNYATAANLAQTIETMRQFVRQLPDGTKYDSAMVNWMRSTQMEAGIADQILHILENDVSNPEARFAAQQLHQALHSLQQSSGIPPTTPPSTSNPVIPA